MNIFSRFFAALARVAGSLNSLADVIDSATGQIAERIPFTPAGTNGSPVSNGIAHKPSESPDPVEAGDDDQGERDDDEPIGTPRGRGRLAGAGAGGKRRN